MVRNIDEMQKLGKDNMDATLKSFGALSKRTFVAEATKLGELYADFAKEAYKPFESQFGKVASVK